MGQALGWRFGFATVGLLALLTVALVWLFVPADKPDAGAAVLRELGALKRRQVWLTLAALMAVTGVAPAIVPIVLCVFGIGMTVGTFVSGWAADHALMPTIGGILLLSVASLAMFPVAAGNIYAVSVVVFLIGCGGGLGTVARIAHVAVEGPGGARSLELAPPRVGAAPLDKQAPASPDP